MKNKLFIVLLVGLLLIGFNLTAFAEDLASDGFPVPRVVTDRPLKVGMVFQSLAIESVVRHYQQAKIESTHRGWDVVLQVGMTDTERRDIMQTFITKDVDAIVIGNMAMLPLKELIAQARQKGIGVYNVDTQLMPGSIANCNQPNGVAACKLFYRVGEDLLWQGKVAIITSHAVSVNGERTDAIKGVIQAYPGLEIVGEEEVVIGGADYRQQAYDFTKTWITKYGDELDVVIGSWDGAAVGAANAITASGFDQTQIFSIGLDGGSETWSYIRKGTPFKYSFAQPFELYEHTICELVDQIQVMGLQPGDKGCSILRYGETIYADGRNVSASSVPALGENVHAVFDYYGGDPNDPDAWYNWQDEGGPYKVGTELK